MQPTYCTYNKPSYSPPQTYPENSPVDTDTTLRKLLQTHNIRIPTNNELNEIFCNDLVTNNRIREKIKALLKTLAPKIRNLAKECELPEETFKQINFKQILSSKDDLCNYMQLVNNLCLKALVLRNSSLDKKVTFSECKQWVQHQANNFSLPHYACCGFFDIVIRRNQQCIPCIPLEWRDLHKNPQKIIHCRRVIPYATPIIILPFVLTGAIVGLIKYNMSASSDESSGSG